MGSTHFLTKTLPKVRTEMSLHVLAYNLKRVMKILGVVPLMEAIPTEGGFIRPNIGLFAASVIGPQAFDEISRPTRSTETSVPATARTGFSADHRPRKSSTTPLVGFYTACTHCGHSAGPT